LATGSNVGGFFYALENFFNFFPKNRVVKNVSKSPYGEQGINSNKNPAQRRIQYETQIKNQCCKQIS
jgi:hypothetical protein